MEFAVNKGIGRGAEFKGLTAQYLVIFAGGLLAVFVLFIVLYLMGVAQWFCIVFCLAAALTLVWAVFRLSKRYGKHGLMKRHAARSHPRRVINRKRFFKDEKYSKSRHAGE